jgi:asparagine synthase (glutamine-hydrolysing)
VTALAGFWALGAHREPGGAVERMLKAQSIYAAAAPTIISLGDIALGRRLFPLLDEDVHDRGPVTAAGGRWIVVADVRLDNRKELADALGIHDARARLLSDADIVAGAVERWEEEAPAWVRGDFAFAAWDRSRDRLLLARDHVGQRPLYFHRGPGFFAFASMPKGLHALPEVPREPNREAFIRSLALLHEEGTESLFRGLERLPAGHLCVATATGTQLSRWWNPPRSTLRLAGPDAYHAAVREAFDRAVEMRLRGAGGGVATHLTGGLDSSAVTATAAQLLAGEGKVHAFTAAPREGFEARVGYGRFADESGHAAAVAALYPNIEHVVVRTTGRSPLAALDRYAFLYDRPIGNLCNAVWGDAILDGAKARGLKVLLTGQMGNLSFSFTGFPRLAELLRRGRLVKLARESLALRRGGLRLESIAAHAVGPYLPAAAWLAINRWRGRRLDLRSYSAIAPEAAAQLEAAAAGRTSSSRPDRDAFASRLRAIAWTDIGEYQKGMLGGWGIDARDPTGDRGLLELCLSIPMDQYLRGGHARALARGAFADRLPSIIIEETRKGLQGADWYEGLDAARGEVTEQVARIVALGDAEGMFDTAQMHSLVDNWPGGGWSDDSVTASYRLALLRAIGTGHFLRKVLGSN